MTDDRTSQGDNERQDSNTTQTDPAGAPNKNPAHSPSNEYEPNDSRNVTGVADTPDGRWSGDKQDGQASGEYEPRDSRNVTGAASTEDGRWTNDSEKLAPGDD